MLRFVLLLIAGIDRYYDRREKTDTFASYVMTIIESFQKGGIITADISADT